MRDRNEVTDGHDDVEYPTTYARHDPDRVVAHHLLGLGLAEGDHIAVAMGNRAEFLEICWRPDASSSTAPPSTRT